MAERVIGNLEAIEVEAHYGEALLVTLGASTGVIDAIIQQNTVRQSGEGIVVSDVRDFVRLHLQFARAFPGIGFAATKVVPNAVKSDLVANAERDGEQNQKCNDSRYGDVN